MNELENTVIISYDLETAKRLLFHLRVLCREYDKAIRTLQRARKQRVVWATNEELIIDRKKWEDEVGQLIEQLELVLKETIDSVDRSVI